MAAFQNRFEAFTGKQQTVHVGRNGRRKEMMEPQRPPLSPPILMASRKAIPRAPVKESKEDQLRNALQRMFSEREHLLRDNDRLRMENMQLRNNFEKGLPPNIDLSAVVFSWRYRDSVAAREINADYESTAQERLLKTELVRQQQQQQQQRGSLELPKRGPEFPADERAIPRGGISPSNGVSPPTNRRVETMMVSSELQHCTETPIRWSNNPYFSTSNRNAAALPGVPPLPSQLVNRYAFNGGVRSSPNLERLPGMDGRAPTQQFPAAQPAYNRQIPCSCCPPSGGLVRGLLQHSSAFPRQSVLSHEPRFDGPSPLPHTFHPERSDVMRYGSPSMNSFDGRSAVMPEPLRHPPPQNIAPTHYGMMEIVGGYHRQLSSPGSGGMPRFLPPNAAATNYAQFASDYPPLRQEAVHMRSSAYSYESRWTDSILPLNPEGPLLPQIMNDGAHIGTSAARPDVTNQWAMRQLPDGRCNSFLQPSALQTLHHHQQLQQPQQQQQMQQQQQFLSPALPRSQQLHCDFGYSSPALVLTTGNSQGIPPANNDGGQDDAGNPRTDEEMDILAKATAELFSPNSAERLMMEDEMAGDGGSQTFGDYQTIRQDVMEDGTGSQQPISYLWEASVAAVTGMESDQSGSPSSSIISSQPVAAADGSSSFVGAIPAMQDKSVSELTTGDNVIYGGVRQMDLLAVENQANGSYHVETPAQLSPIVSDEAASAAVDGNVPDYNEYIVNTVVSTQNCRTSKENQIQIVDSLENEMPVVPINATTTTPTKDSSQVEVGNSETSVHKSSLGNLGHEGLVVFSESELMEMVDRVENMGVTSHRKRKGKRSLSMEEIGGQKRHVAKRRRPSGDVVENGNISGAISSGRSASSGEEYGREVSDGNEFTAEESTKMEYKGDMSVIGGSGMEASESLVSEAAANPRKNVADEEVEKLEKMMKNEASNSAVDLTNYSEEVDFEKKPDADELQTDENVECKLLELVAREAEESGKNSTGYENLELVSIEAAHDTDGVQLSEMVKDEASDALDGCDGDECVAEIENLKCVAEQVEKELGNAATLDGSAEQLTESEECCYEIPTEAVALGEEMIRSECLENDGIGEAEKVAETVGNEEIIYEMENQLEGSVVVENVERSAETGIIYEMENQLEGSVVVENVERSAETGMENDTNRDVETDEVQSLEETEKSEISINVETAESEECGKCEILVPSVNEEVVRLENMEDIEAEAESIDAECGESFKSAEIAVQTELEDCVENSELATVCETLEQIVEHIVEKERLEILAPTELQSTEDGSGLDISAAMETPEKEDYGKAECEHCEMEVAKNDDSGFLGVENVESPEQGLLTSDPEIQMKNTNPEADDSPEVSENIEDVGKIYPGRGSLGKETDRRIPGNRKKKRVKLLRVTCRYLSADGKSECLETVRVQTIPDNPEMTPLENDVTELEKLETACEAATEHRDRRMEEREGIAAKQEFENRNENVPESLCMELEDSGAEGNPAELENSDAKGNPAELEISGAGGNPAELENSGAEGNPAELENSDAEGNPAELENSGAGGNPAELENSGAEGNLAELENSDAEGNHAELKNSGAGGNPAELENSDAEGNHAELEKSGAGGNPAELENSDAEGNPAELEKSGAGGNPAELENSDAEGNPAELENSGAGGSMMLNGSENFDSVVKVDDAINTCLTADGETGLIGSKMATDIADDALDMMPCVELDARVPQQSQDQMPSDFDGKQSGVADEIPDVSQEVNENAENGTLESTNDIIEELSCYETGALPNLVDSNCPTGMNTEAETDVSEAEIQGDNSEMPSSGVESPMPFLDLQLDPESVSGPATDPCEAAEDENSADVPEEAGTEIESAMPCLLKQVSLELSEEEETVVLERPGVCESPQVETLPCSANCKPNVECMVMVDVPIPNVGIVEEDEPLSMTCENCDPPTSETPAVVSTFISSGLLQHLSHRHSKEEIRLEMSDYESCPGSDSYGNGISPNDVDLLASDSAAENEYFCSPDTQRYFGDKSVAEFGNTSSVSRNCFDFLLGLASQKHEVAASGSRAEREPVRCPRRQDVVRRDVFVSSSGYDGWNPNTALEIQDLRNSISIPHVTSNLDAYCAQSAAVEEDESLSPFSTSGSDPSWSSIVSPEFCSTDRKFVFDHRVTDRVAWTSDNVGEPALNQLQSATKTSQNPEVAASQRHSFSSDSRRNPFVRKSKKLRSNAAIFSAKSGTEGINRRESKASPRSRPVIDEAVSHSHTQAFAGHRSESREMPELGRLGTPIVTLKRLSPPTFEPDGRQIWSVQRTASSSPSKSRKHFRGSARDGPSITSSPFPGGTSELSVANRQFAQFVHSSSSAQRVISSRTLCEKYGKNADTLHRVHSSHRK